MRICPKCGYHDSPCWRPRLNRPYCDYSAVGNIGYSEPELIQKIKEVSPIPFYDGHYVYRITKTGRNVERIELEYFKFMGWGREPTEKRDLPVLPEKLEKFIGNKRA